MLQLSTLKFLSDLNRNNNKAWFDAHKNNYEEAKADFSLFTQKSIVAIATFDNTIANLQPKDCMFRINRDVRFSKDKSPYKNNMGASISKDGKKINCAGYYIHCQPGQSFIAGGIWMPEAHLLSKIRQEIDYNFTHFKKIINAPLFKKHFAQSLKTNESLLRPPKGYDDTHAAIEFIKLKSFVVSQPLTDTEMQSKQLIKELTKSFKIMHPFINFLNAAIS